MNQTVTIPGVGDVEFPDTMSDDDIAVAAKRLSADAPKFDVKAQNATMRANMAKQPEGTGVDPHPFVTGAVESPYVKYGPGRVVEGVKRLMGATPDNQLAKGAHNVITGMGVTALPFAPAATLAAPAAAIGGLILGAPSTYLARKGAELVTDNPDYVDLAGDAGGLIGGAAGAKLGAASPGIIGKGLSTAGEAVESTPSTRQMVGGLIRKAGDKMQGKPVVKLGPAPKVVKPPPTPAEQMGLDPNSIGATMPETHLGTTPPPNPLRGADPIVDRTGPAANFKEQPLWRQQEALETYGAPAEPVATTRNPDPTFPQVGGRGTPESPEARQAVAKAFADRQAAAPRLSKQPGPQPLENELASTLREPLATLTDDEAVASEAPGRGDMTRTGRPATTPQDFAADQAKLDTGTATRSQGALDPETTAMEKVVNGEPLTDDEKLIIAKRLTSQANSAPKPGNTTQARHPETGQFIKADEAAKKGVEATMTPEERALIGNRGAGAATIDKRKQMLDELIARARAEGK